MKKIILIDGPMAWRRLTINPDIDYLILPKQSEDNEVFQTVEYCRHKDSDYYVYNKDKVRTLGVAVPPDTKDKRAYINYIVSEKFKMLGIDTNSNITLLKEAVRQEEAREIIMIDFYIYKGAEKIPK